MLYWFFTKSFIAKSPENTKKNIILLAQTLVSLWVLNVVSHGLAFFIRAGIFKMPVIVGHFCRACTFSPTYPFYRSPLFLAVLIKTGFLLVLYYFILPITQKRSILTAFLLVQTFIFGVFFLLYDFGVSAFFAAFSDEYLFSKHHLNDMYLLPAFFLGVWVLLYVAERRKWLAAEKNT
jgi:hypothetical protein